MVTDSGVALLRPARSSPPGGSFTFARFEVPASASFDGTTLDLPLDPSREAVTLRFDPEPSTLEIDGDAVSVEAIATTEENGEVGCSRQAFRFGYRTRPIPPHPAHRDDERIRKRTLSDRGRGAWLLGARRAACDIRRKR